MYRVTVLTDGKEYMLHDINSEDEQIYDDEWTEEMGKTASFRFSLAPNHPNGNKIHPLSSEIRIYKDGRLQFWGRAINPAADMYNTRTIECVGGLSYLADSLQAPFSISGTGTDFLKQLLSVHNSMVDDYKQLQLGTVNVGIRDAERVQETYADTLSIITSMLVNNYGGYLRVRESKGIRYLDYLTNYGGINKQDIRFGDNILDLSMEIEAVDIATIIIPAGAETEDGVRVGITAVNGGCPYVQDVQAVQKWGKVWKYVQFDDITDPAELLKEAKKYLLNLTSFPQTIHLTAFDLSLADSNIEALQLGYWTNFISDPHGLRGNYLLQKLVRHLTAPQNDTVTFGIVRETISGTTANTGQIVTQKVEQVKQQLGKEMDEKIENATKLITGGTGGYFVIGLNGDGQPNETFWMDSPSTETAKNVIRMNHNGLGFSTTGINGPYRNAWTIDGNLVADFIASGTMLADRIRGGALEVGGPGLGKDGIIYVKDASGNVLVQLDASGIQIFQGTINLGNGAFKVSSSGVMELNGTNNSSTIGCNVLHANNANISSGLDVEGTTNTESLNSQEIFCHGDISCSQIYSKTAGEWWSDRRLKKKIKDIPLELCEKIVSELRPVSFVFKEDGMFSVGFVAQDVKKILKKHHINLPLVNKHAGFYCIPYAAYVSILAGAARKQAKDIEIIKKKVGLNG